MNSEPILQQNSGWQIAQHDVYLTPQSRLSKPTPLLFPRQVFKFLPHPPLKQAFKPLLQPLPHMLTVARKLALLA